MLVKISSIDRIEVLESGQIQVRRVDRILEDDAEISKAYHRWTLSPGDDLSGQDSRVTAVAQAVWTPEIIATYQQMLQQNLQE